MANGVPMPADSGVPWSPKFPPDEWPVYREVIEAAQRERIPFALGGAFSLGFHVGAFHGTKDLDLYVLPAYRKRMIALVTRLGYQDYFDQAPYDRHWIYRATAGGMIVDLIWSMANRRAPIDKWWLSGPEVDILGTSIRVLPAEVLLWDKLYIMQKERCDWPDVMNLLHFRGKQLDWEALLQSLGEDRPLLAGALSVFGWLSPGIAREFPKWVWEKLQLPAPGGPRIRTNPRHAALLDRRPWYGKQRK